MGFYRENKSKVNDDWRLSKDKATGKCWKVNPACKSETWDLYFEAVERKRLGYDF